MKPCIWFTLLLHVTAQACTSGERDGAPSVDSASPIETAIVDSGFATVAESAWVDVSGRSLIAFYPVVSNDSLAKDEGLASALDDLAYHIGTAMDSLIAAGLSVTYRGGDTLWIRSGSDRWRFIRPSDSSDVGYVFTDSLRRVVPLYGVRGFTELVEYAHEFRRTGEIRPRVK
jgi:hypothetical protein